jgi:hypothetical protein
MNNIHCRYKAILLIATISLFTSIISCVTWHYYMDTKIYEIEITNGFRKGDIFYKSDSLREKVDNFAIIVKCYINDSTTDTQKDNFNLLNTSLISNTFASEPGKGNNYKIIDSLINILITSEYDFNDNYKSGADMTNFFSIGYKENLKYNGLLDDSITNPINIINIKQISEELTDNKRSTDIVYLLFTLHVKPKYEMQRFITRFEFQSGKYLTDTSKLIYLQY